MAALDARFRDHTISLFKKHGMTPIALLPCLADARPDPLDDRLFYVMGYKDRAARDAAWTAFASDPEWKQVYADSQKDGSLTSKIENIFLTADGLFAQAESHVRPPRRAISSCAPTRPTPGKLEDLHTRFRDHTLRIFWQARHDELPLLAPRRRPADA